MTELNHVTLNVTDVTGWTEADITTLTHWMSGYANILGDRQEYKALHYIRMALAMDCGYPTHELDQWFRIVLNLLFYELVSMLTDYIKAYCLPLTEALQTITQHFSPIIHGKDSRLQNRFDQIDFQQTRENIIQQAVKLLRA
jgi:hypothetical protein